VTRHTSVTRRHLERSAHRRISSVRPRHTRQVGHKAQRGVAHRATVRLRISVSATCGNCHGCKQTQPSIKPIPERQPFLVGPRPRPLDGWPWREAGRRAGPMVQLPAKKPGPMVGPRPEPLRFVVRKPGPGPLPAVEPPALPPLGVVRLGEPRRPLLDRMTDGKPDDLRPSVGDAPEKPRSAVESSPPPLPALEGSVALLAPLLAQKEDRVSPASAPSRSDLQPDLVVQAPALAPLPGVRTHQQGLLPTLDGDDPVEALDESRQTTLVEVTLRPPPLPPLPETAVP
jgi:hypothetical protein